MYNYALNNQNYTFFGVLFDIKKDNGITNYRYQIWYNSTLNYNATDSFGSRVLSVARGIDEAIGNIYYFYIKFLIHSYLNIYLY